MEKPSSNHYSLLYLLLPIYLQFLCFFSLPSSSHAADSPPTHLRINCGSPSDVDDANYGAFTADKSPKFFRISEGSNTATATPAGTTTSLYQTARFFRQHSRYTFEVAPNSTYYLLRLHFAAFYTQSANLYAAVFNVSTSNKALLRNFSPSNSTVVVSEFYVPVANSSEFKIYFIPAETNNTSSPSSPPLAFVNAIEFLRLPPNLLADNQSQAFRTLYRVDIGGGGGRDDYINNLGRQWSPDKDFYTTPSDDTSKNKSMGPSPDLDEDLPPLSILKSCRFENSAVVGPKPSNLTWRFQVKRNSKQFVRLYFFNCEGDGPADFNIYISNLIKSRVATFKEPDYQEYVTDSDSSGYLNISIIPEIPTDDGMNKTAYLNALEIMEFLPNTTVNDSDFVDEIHQKFNLNLVIALSVAGGLIFALICSIVLVLMFRRRKKNNNNKKNSSDSVKKSKSSTAASGKKFHSWMTVKNNTTSHGSPLPELNLKLKMPLAEIMAATDNFNPDRLIGSGGFGKVYAGKLMSGVKVAVKRSEESGHGQGLPEFHTEVLVLSKIRHRHLVSLIGYCDDGDEMILVYEFMKNGTLREYLYTSEHDPPPPLLNWKQRLEICIGSAKGLHYLHTGSDGGIIHRDVKTTNILLDDNLVPKVADFGLSQSGPPDPDHHTMALKGSFGYLDPEFFRTLQLTDKSDVYSFGVVMLEVLCARPPIVNSSNAEEINLAEWGMSWQKKGEIEKIVDPLIAGEINPSSLRKYVEVAEKCLRANGVERPAMLDVCWDLEYALQLQKSTVKREPSEDSMTTMTDGGYSGNVINNMAVDNSFTVDECEEDFSIGGDGFGDSVIMDSEIFSQHRIDGSAVDR